MPHNRFFLDGPINLNETPLLVGEEAHHLQRVMRKSVGERVELVNGCNLLAFAEILASEKKGIRLKIVEVRASSPPTFPVILCQALPRLNRLDTIVEKGTELGMTELWLFPGALSEKKELSPSQFQRLKTVAIAAMKQCGRLDLPAFFLKSRLSEWDSLPFPAYFGDTASTALPFHSVFQKQNGALFFVGPEAGFTAEEEQHLHSLNVQGVHLHPNILRTDTASLAALTLITSL